MWVVLSLLVSIIAVFVFHACWHWFLVPLGMVEIGYVHAFGILIIKDLLFFNSWDKHNPDDLPTKVTNDFIMCIMALIMGYGIHLMM